MTTGNEQDIDISGSRARRRKLILGLVVFTAIFPWFFSPWRRLFFYAIRSNNVGLVRVMLSAGADPNASEASASEMDYADTPLVAAVRSPCRSMEILRLLLDHHADPNARGGRDRICVPLSHIDPSCPDSVAIADALVSAGAKATVCACVSPGSGKLWCPILGIQKSIPLARRLLELGVDPNQVCSSRDTAPVDSVGGELKALYFEHGAKVVPDPKTGETMLHRFAQRGRGVDGDDTEWRLTESELALNHGADVNAVDAKGHTPMDYALQEDDEAMVELLSRYGGKSKKTEDLDGKSNAEEDQSEYSSFRTFAGNVHPAPGCSLKLVGENHSIMEEGVNLTVIKGTVATARVRCPSGGYVHWAVLGMGAPIPKQINIPLQAGVTPVEVTFDKTWINGEMHWYYTRGRVPSLLHSIKRGEVRQIDVRYINVADSE
jgi:hypothetical protein